MQNVFRINQCKIYVQLTFGFFFFPEISPVLLGIPAPRGPLRDHFWKKKCPQPYWGERILEMLWSLQMRWIIGLGGSQLYSRGEFQEKLWEHFQGLSGILSEFLPESPSRIWGMTQFWGMIKCKWTQCSVRVCVYSLPCNATSKNYMQHVFEFYQLHPKFTCDYWFACDLPFVQMALQTEKMYFRINFACRSRYRCRRNRVRNSFFVADADTAVLCSLERAA